MNQSNSGAVLKQFVERIDRLEDEKKAVADDIKEVYAEAKAMGFDTKVLRKVVADLRKDGPELDEQRALYDMYMDAIRSAIGAEEGGEDEVV